MAVLGDVPDAGVESFLGGRVRHVASVDDDPPGRRVAEPGDRVDQLGLPVRVDAGEADDLAAPHLEADVTDGLEAAVVDHAQVLHLQQRLAGLRRVLVDTQQHLAPDHHPREPFLGRPRGRDRVDDDATAQRRDAIGDVEDLVRACAR